MAKTFEVGDTAMGQNGVLYTITQVERRDHVMPRLSRYTVAHGDKVIANFPGYQFAETLREKTERFIETETISKPEWDALAKEWLERL